MSKIERYDIEAQQTKENEKSHSFPSPHASPKLGSEYRTAASTKFTHLAVYFLCNVSLTIYNKAVLGKFGYPWLLTALHAGSASIGCYVLLVRGNFTLTKLSNRENFTLGLFSLLFTVNIAISNVSLAMVSMPTHQILRSTTPIFAISINRIYHKRSYSTRTYLSLIPLVLGVALSTYGDYYFTPIGFVLTVLGVVLAAVKTVVSNRVMTGYLALSPLETLFRLSPLAFIQSLLYAYISGELSFLSISPIDSSTIVSTLSSTRSLKTAVTVAGNGILAFTLNVASFSANRSTGALTMTVCGNVKQCLTVLLGVLVFGARVGWANGIGMVIALGGAAWYGILEVGRRK